MLRVGTALDMQELDPGTSGGCWHIQGPSVHWALLVHLGRIHMLGAASTSRGLSQCLGLSVHLGLAVHLRTIQLTQVTISISKGWWSIHSPRGYKLTPYYINTVLLDMVWSKIFIKCYSLCISRASTSSHVHLFTLILFPLL